MRILVTGLVAAVVAVGMLPAEVGRAQDSGYRLVADWPTLPSGVFFGQQRGWPNQAARDAAAAARRAAGGGRGGARPTTPPIYGQGISGIAIDDHDAPRVAPGGGCIARFRVDVCSPPGPGALGARMVQGRFGVPRQDGVLGHRHDVSDVRLSFQEVKRGGCGEAAVR